MLLSAAVDILEEIRRVLDIEIEGLQSVRSNLNSNFARAVEVIASFRCCTTLATLVPSCMVAYAHAVYRMANTVPGRCHDPSGSL